MTIPPHWALTAAESEAVQYLATGCTPQQIADALKLSVHTIRTQLKHAMAKAGAHTQVALVARVYGSGQ